MSSIVVNQIKTTTGDVADVNMLARADRMIAHADSMPDIRPSLNIDCVNNKRLDSRVALSRASGGGRYNSLGKYEWLGNDVPRFDYDPITKVVKGLLIEEQRTNLLRYSEQFDNAAWLTNEAAIRANVGVAPDGTLSADGFIPSTVAANHFVRPSTLISVAPGVVWTATCFFKAAGHTGARITFEGTGWVGAVQPAASFSLEDGVVSRTSASAQFAAITPAGDGWYRCSLTATATSTFITRVGIWVPNPDGSNAVFAGDGTSGIYIWGAQLEQGSFPTSYIPTKAIFTARNSIGTYHDSTGVLRTAAANVARYDHGYVDGQWVSKGLLLEGQSTNIAINSNQFDGGWSVFGITVDGYVTAPDGTAAPIWLASNTAALHRLQRQGLSGGAGNTVHTGSFYCHLPVGHDVSRLYIRMRSTGDGQTVAVLVSGSGDAAAFTFHSSGPFGTNAPPLVNASALNVTPAGNGWHRISVTSTTSTTTNPVTSFDFGFTRENSEIAAGTANTRIAFFGAQLEQGDRPTSYIPTPAGFTSRASTKTYFDAQGVMRTAAVDEAAIDHAYINGQWVRKGLSVEGQATNLLTYSEQFASPNWAAYKAVANPALMPSPRGDLRGITLTETTVSGEHFAESSISVVSGSTYTFSIYVAAAGRADIGLRMTVGSLWPGGVSPQVRFNLANETATVVTGSPSGYGIVDVGEGLYRVFMTVLCAASGTAAARTHIMNTSNNSYTGDGTSGLYIWGAQLEAGSQPTSYIPTTTAQVTRAADVTSSAQVTRVADSSTSSQVTRAADIASVNDLSGWYRQDEGTLVVEAVAPNATQSFARTASLEKPGQNIMSIQRHTSSNARGFGYGFSLDAGAQSFPAGTPVKAALTVGGGSASICSQGGTVASVAAPPLLMPTKLCVGSAISGTSFLNGHIKSIKYLPRRVSDDELKALTV